MPVLKLVIELHQKCQQAGQVLRHSLFRPSLRDWLIHQRAETDDLQPVRAHDGRCHAGIDHPIPSRAPATPVQRPPLVTTADEATDPARRTARLALSAVLVAFCLFVIGFWIYVALTSWGAYRRKIGGKLRVPTLRPIQ
jgi:hypothetical protein